MEYKLAKKIGYSNKSIVYNGPVKGKALFEHLAEGGVTYISNCNSNILYCLSGYEYCYTAKRMEVRFC